MTNGLTWTPRAELAFQAVADALIDRQISSGQDRTVYSLTHAPDMVLKVSRNNTSQNTIEYETWQRVSGTEFERWFAPVISCGGDGTCLVMKRTTDRPRSEYPERIPAFFCDTKYSNFGWIGNRFVCHDYGTTNLFSVGMTKRLVKAKWWAE